MKIGFSLSYCVQDIYDGKVSMEDILVIYTGTKIIDDGMFEDVIKSYVAYARMTGDPKALTEIALKLYHGGKIHQPRTFSNGYPIRISQGEHWADLIPTVTSDNENVREAWTNYRLLLQLTEDKIENQALDR